MIILIGYICKQCLHVALVAEKFGVTSEECSGFITSTVTSFFFTSVDRYPFLMKTASADFISVREKPDG